MEITDKQKKIVNRLLRALLLIISFLGVGIGVYYLKINRLFLFSKASNCVVNKTSKLFLDYWGGMSLDEFECITDKLNGISKISKSNNRIIFIIETQDENESDTLIINKDFFDDKLYLITLSSKKKPRNEVLRGLISKYGRNYKLSTDTFAFYYNESIIDSHVWESENKQITYSEIYSGPKPNLLYKKDDNFDLELPSPKILESINIEFLDLKIFDDMLKSDLKDSLRLNNKAKEKLREL